MMLWVSLTNILFEILLLLLVLVILIGVASFFIIRDLKLEFKKVYKIRSRFHIEIRKIVNLIYNVHQPASLEPFTKVVIKKLPHEEKKILLKHIDKAFLELDPSDENNKYIIETYENLQNLRRERDAKILHFNQKTMTFPFTVYAKIMKLENFKLYTEKE